MLPYSDETGKEREKRERRGGREREREIEIWRERDRDLERERARRCLCVKEYMCYEVATISKLLKILGLLCQRAL